MTKKFKIKLHYETIIEVADNDNVIDTFMKEIESTPQQTLDTFVIDNTIIEEIVV